MSWWDEAVVYEVYLRSYVDADGDGIGDLPGLASRLDHLVVLGVDALWLTPCQPSPQIDNGYDVADYTDVDALFGGMSAFTELVEAAHARGLRVLMDLVPNHCSAQHPAFQAALAAGPGSRERELFHFRPGSPDGTPPNGWTSVFGGPAWSRANPDDPADPDWYLHLFAPGQPDWNWDDPRVGAMFDDVVRFWFDHGVDGLRIDVAHALFKAPGLPDVAGSPSVVDGLRFNPAASDQEAVHDVYRRWRAIADAAAPPRMLVGEVNLLPERAARFARPDELHHVFPYAFVALGWDVASWVAAGTDLEAARRRQGSAAAWALENHDIVRSVTRYGGGELGRRRALAALVTILGLPGTVYLYQGQELGLAEVDVPLTARVDPMWRRGGVCRDGARVPLPWTREPVGAHGFSLDPTVQPWLPQPEGWGELAVAVQAASAYSHLTQVRDAVAARRALVAEGLLRPDLPLTWHATPTGGLRCDVGQHLVLVLAMGEQAEELPEGDVCFRVGGGSPNEVAPAGAAWVKVGTPLS